MTTSVDSKISCEICGAKIHAIHIHLREAHTDISVDKYKEMFPESPLLSEFAEKKIAAARAEKAEKERIATKIETKETIPTSTKKAMSKVFELGSTKAAKAANGSEIMIDVLGSTEWDMQIPDVDPNYIPNIEVLKTIMMCFQLNMPVYLWGHAGTGKTSMFDQICARTRRPSIRVNHTGSTEESHIVGQMVASIENGTEWSPGPLPLAMKYGWTYIADEYDFAFPQVLSVYQAVLEGKALVIKEAPADSEWRVVHPHPNFRFVATGNTNGSGDSSGLYLGTNVQNSANYERFSVVEEMPYMEHKQEAAVIAQQAGVSIDDADKLVQFAKMVRDAFSARQIKATIGPRVLINAAKVGLCKGSFMKGITSSFLNRLTPKDKEICHSLAQRVIRSE